MNLKNVMQKMIVLPMTACVLFLGMQFTEASRLNPFSNVQTLDISGEAKATYIDEKTTNFLILQHRLQKNTLYQMVGNKKNYHLMACR